MSLLPMWMALVRVFLLVIALGAVSTASAELCLQHESDSIPLQPISTSEPGEPEQHYQYLCTSQHRLANLTQHDDDRLKPDYALVHQLSLPQVPQFAPGYQVALSPALDWSLSTRAPPSRLGGWKESNHLYRFAQRSVSIA